MTEKELRKLKRPELMEILYYLKKEADTLREENESLKQQLEIAQGGISSENLEKIIEAVRTASSETIREHSEEKTADENESKDETDSGKENPEKPSKAGKRKDG